MFASAQRRIGNAVWFSFYKPTGGSPVLLLSVGRRLGPAFIKVCAYFPYPLKVWINGHESAECQARRAGIGSLNCPTGSPAAPIRRCRRSATGLAEAPSRCSSSAG